MPVNKRLPLLICYDIANPKRLQRVHRVVSHKAVMVQYSVYYTEMNRTEIGRIIREVEECIDKRADDVRIYRLPERIQMDTIGEQASSVLPVLEFRDKLNTQPASRKQKKQ
ncbi:MAG TPA: CRISPR-associated endonuclease Cas2 [Gammaproteobacteria bacterium]|nr:CRISPR-associated endonuclease Cas2 [Gammaproteobacteria bacterium]